jgi:UDP-N-acetylglucosamine 2-epimerase (non-hydrolysing)
MENLRKEGHPEDHLHLTGNVMIDTLKWLLPKAGRRNTLAEYGLKPREYGVVTLHRPSNVDDPSTVTRLVGALARISNDLPLIFPVHPRTRDKLRRFGLTGRLDTAGRVIRVPPLGYLDFLALTSQAKVIISDSGGLQEESTALGIPCLTTRANTERPITVSQGTSTLVGNDTEELMRHFHMVLEGTYKLGCCPRLWDGRAAERIAAVLARDGRRM